jgi:hypothetical protein
MKSISFALSPVNKKPSRTYRKGSKYDPIIDQFLSNEMTLAIVNVPNKDANYIRTQIKKRIDARNLNNSIHVSVVSNKTYLEKI